MWQVATHTITHGPKTTNKIELVQTRYGVATVDSGYHVYVAVWETAVGQMLPCEQEGGNIHDPYAVIVVKIYDTPIDDDTCIF